MGERWNWVNEGITSVCEDVWKALYTIADAERDRGTECQELQKAPHPPAFDLPDGWKKEGFQ